MKFTRKQYLNKECSHQDYYGQFVTEEIKEVVKRSIGLDVINRSKDPTFNDIPLSEWDGFFTFVSFIWPQSKLTEYGEGLSLSFAVCVTKAAARMMKTKN